MPDACVTRGGHVLHCVANPRPVASPRKTWRMPALRTPIRLRYAARSSIVMYHNLCLYAKCWPAYAKSVEPSSQHDVF
jgi:hypothetical protein